MPPTLHRIARRVTLAGLVVLAAALVALIAWTGYVRSSWDPGTGFPGGRSAEGFLPRGFRLIALHPDYGLGAALAGAIAAGGLALAVVVWRGRRWGLLAAGIGSAVVIAGPWLARAYVVHIETMSASRRWAARSPYVAAATDLAIITTIVLGILGVAAIIAFVTAPRAATAAAPPAPDAETGTLSAQRPGQ